jgi:hypothetical protein
MLIEGAKYYTIETTNDHFSMKICGQNARTIRNLYSNIDLNTVRELRFIATYLQITGRSNLNKSELIKAIKKTNGKKRCD